MSDELCCPLSPQAEEMGREHDSGFIGEKVRKWYAVFTMARHEKQTAFHLCRREIESFLPLYKAKHRWKNRRTVEMELPLFPNYVFVRIDPQERVRVLKLPSVVSIVSAAGEPLPVPDRYVSWLRNKLLINGIEPHPGLEVGDRVRITAGAMTGMTGVLDRHKGGFRVVLRLEIIRRSVAVEVDLAELERVDPTPNRIAATSSQSDDLWQ
jgi:transcription antitermination factor NusG